MPAYRLTSPDGQVEVVEAETVRHERAHTVLLRTVLVIGQPREYVVRRVPSTVVVTLEAG